MTLPPGETRCFAGSRRGAASYAQLQHPDDPRIQIAFVERSHESVPENDRLVASGVVS